MRGNMLLKGIKAFSVICLIISNTAESARRLTELELHEEFDNEIDNSITSEWSSENRYGNGNNHVKSEAKDSTEIQKKEDVTKKIDIQEPDQDEVGPVDSGKGHPHVKKELSTEFPSESTPKTNAPEEVPKPTERAEKESPQNKPTERAEKESPQKPDGNVQKVSESVPAKGRADKPTPTQAKNQDKAPRPQISDIQAEQTLEYAFSSHTFINPHKAPSTFWEYMSDLAYGLWSFVTGLFSWM